MYGINQLLGFSRLKLDVELTRSLPYDHTFEVIKRRLYIKNHESVRDEVITSKIKVRQPSHRVSCSCSMRQPHCACDNV